MTVADFLRERLIFAKLAAIILWVSFAISLVLGDSYGTFNFAKELTAADHLAFYTAARLVSDGRGDQIYDNATVAAVQQDLLPLDRWNLLSAYRNPPFFCLLFLPTCRLPFIASAGIWAVVTVSLLWLGVRWLGGGRTAFLWLLSFYPVFCVVSYGQNSLIGFAVLAATYRLLQNDRRFAAGLVAGLLLFKPTELLGVVIWGLLDLRRLWPATVGVVVSTLLLCSGSYLVVAPAWHAFFEQLQGNAAFADFEQWKLHNPLGFARLLFPHAEQWHWPFAIACGGLALAWFVQLWRAKRDDLPTMFGAVAVLTLWASPHAMIYEWGILGVAAVLWWPKFANRPDARLTLYAVVWLVFLLSSHAARMQLKAFGFGVQLSVPVMAGVAIVASRLLRRAG